MLASLVLRSKAYWGYDANFMSACRDELTVAPEEVASRRVVVAEDGRRVVGVASLEGDPPAGELGLLFVEPDVIGGGVGRVLYHHVLSTARALGFTRLSIEADPNAVSFYRAMGARPAGIGPSRSVPGRELPVLAVDLSRPAGWVRAWTGERAVHVGNVAEFQAQFGPVDPVAGAHYACMAAFASPHPAVLVLPWTVPGGWIALVARQLAWDGVEVFDGLDDPAGPCAAVLARPALATYLQNRGVSLVPWGRTRAFAELAGERWRPEALRFESKRVAHELFLRLAPDHPEIRVPEQRRAATRWAAARMLRSRAGRVTVVKTDHGAGGSGTWLVDGRRPALPRGPLLVEEHVTGWDLTYDGLVDPAGRSHDVGVAVMDVRGTAYLGATVGPGVVPDPAAGAASRFGRAVGQELAALGYQGWFDVDFVVDTDGRLAPTEVNVRLTGPSVAFMIKARLDEIRGGDHLVRTVDRVPLGARLPRPVPLLRQLTRRCAEVGAVLVPTIPTAAFDAAPFLGVALAAHDRATLDTAEALVRAAALDTGRIFTP